MSELTSEELRSSIVGLANRQKALMDYLRGVELNPIVHLAIASIYRSMELSRGFLVMVADSNEICAVPLIRLQMDSAMRCYAHRIVADPQAYVLHLCEGKKGHEFTSQTGDKLSDKFLHEQLSNDPDYEYFTDEYQLGSGYVHFSQHHLMKVLELDSCSDDQIVLANLDGPTAFTDQERSDLLLTFLYATHVLVTELERAFPDYFAEVDSGRKGSAK